MMLHGKPVVVEMPISPMQMAAEAARREEFDREVRAQGGKPLGEKAKPEYGPLAFTSPTQLQGARVPEREWIVPGWMPNRTVTLHYAQGGEGKTLLAQQLMTSCATGRPWLGLIVNPCRAIGLFCEDDADEMHRRQEAINRSYGIDFDDLEDMRWSCPVGDDNTLVRFEQDGTPIFTDRFFDFRDQAAAFCPGLIVLDVAADLFGGNENVRQQVALFLKAGLGSLARDLNASVLLNAHPSRSGISSGDLDGGSTGWNGAARSRWALVTPRGDGDEPVDEDARILMKKKANYSRRGDEIKLRWVEGVLVAEQQETTGTVASIEKQNAESVFLDLLKKFEPTGRHVSESRNSANYGPRLFSQHPDRKGFNKRDLELAMNRLFAAGHLRVEHYGAPSDKTRHIVQTPAVESSEP